ncbi:hypothetical protein LTR56_019362 [Elasticomyces elasticus]|nr:hypothetical protein LTR56_019362 [Elasticomyces elasticus]KAK3658604.1 hypothetical protein LTR22_008776 [Elasticomyces elasticus]KAK4911376.1 hypothetical protein LTR49_020027 [Elasticomyces elasticus]KAK5683341.1 hypothetical protein LTS10_004872 [Elasticomyces elasticus]KAK5747036.1 hypothetical protein LTS12_022502 [Elasticomyces elasticus]
MRADVAAFLVLSSSLLAPRTVVADSCQGTFDFFFIGWNVVLDGVTGICDNNNLFDALQNGQGVNCIGVTGFVCNDAGTSTTFGFNEPLFCGAGQVANAVQQGLSRTVTCNGGL